MLTLEVRELRAVERAEVPLGDAQVTLLVGDHGAGKSSIIAAAQALLTRDPSPLGRTRDDRRIQQRDAAKGTAAASASLAAEGGGSITLDIASGKLSERGETATIPHLSLIAAGLVRPAALDDKERSAAFVGALGLYPTREQVREALTKTPLFEGSPITLGELFWRQPGPGKPALPVVDDIVRALFRSHDALPRDAAWDEAINFVADEGRAAKRDFQSAAGSAWGAKVAQIALERLREPVKDYLDADAIEAAIKDAEAARDDALRRQGRQAAATADVVSMKARILEIDQAVALVDADLADARKAHEEAAAMTARVRFARSHVACPACRAELRVLNGTTLERASEPVDPTIPKITVEKALEAERGAKASLDGLQQRLGSLGIERASLVAQIAKAEAAAAAPEAAGPTVDEADGRLAELRKHREAWRELETAERANRDILIAAAVLRVLAPEGLRAACAAEVLAEVNGSLAELSEHMRCPRVAIRPDFGLELGGRPYRALSAGERIKVDLALQLEIAMRQGAPLVVVDECHQLTAPAMAGFLAALWWTEMGALLAGAHTERSAPRLAAEAGVTLWVEGGRIAKRLEAPTSKAA